MAQGSSQAAGSADPDSGFEPTDAAAIFRAGAPGYAADLRAAAEAGDVAALQRLAHRLRGSAAMFGFHEVAVLAASLGRVLARPNPPIQVKDPPQFAECAVQLARACERAARCDR